MNLEDQVMEIMRSVFGIEEISTDISQKNCERWDSLRHGFRAGRCFQYRA